MFVLQNAWSAIGHHRWRTLGLTLLAALVAGGMMVGLSITSAAHTAQTTEYNALQPIVSIRLDRKSVMKKEGASKASDVDWSKHQLNLSKFLQYAQTASEQTQIQFTTAFYSETATLDAIQDAKLPQGSTTLTLTGFSEQAALDNAINGPFTLVKGKFPGFDTDSAGKVMVPQALAQANHWKVGDKISIIAKSGAQPTEVTISGIYSNKQSVDGEATGLDPQTAIYCSRYELAQLGIEMQDPDATTNYLDISVGVPTPDDVAKIDKAMKKAGLSSDFTLVSSTLDKYNASIAPLVQRADITRIALPVMIGIAALLLLITLAVTWRDANEEIGMLMLLGRSRLAIAWQFFMQIMPSVVIGWIIGALACGFTTGHIAQALGITHAVAPSLSIIGTVVWSGILTLVITLVLAWIRTLMVTKTAVLGSRLEVEHE